MELFKILISIGLLLDVFGVYLLWEYGLPSKIIEEHGILSGGLTKEDKSNNKKIHKRSRLGLSFMVFGFALQLIGTIIQPTI